MLPNQSFNDSSGLSGLMSPLNDQLNGPVEPAVVNSSLTAFNGRWNFKFSQEANMNHIYIQYLSNIFISFLFEI